uniref:Uncharacterized protein n=1 Tax=Setaria italica TaxID=4555 RepID=K4A4D7_SETIT
MLSRASVCLACVKVRISRKLHTPALAVPLYYRGFPPLLEIRAG